MTMEEGQVRKLLASSYKNVLENLINNIDIDPE